MNKPTIEEEEVSSNEIETESTKEWINQTIQKIHGKMVELFQINFAYFSDIKIIKEPEILKLLTERMRNNLKENEVVYSDTQWKQIHEYLLKNQVKGFFENMAFYDRKDKALYISESLIKNHPRLMIPVCTHELSEKMLSSFLSSPLESYAGVFIKTYIETEKTTNTKRLYELLNEYIDIVFKSIFKEGCCEAISLQTLLHIGPETRVAHLEKELQAGHTKCMGLLFALDNVKKTIERLNKDATGLEDERYKTQPEGERKLIHKILRASQVIKGVSYYLGYPLAKAVIEKYGIEGVKLALEKYPPLKAEYFADPQAYLALLESQQGLTLKRR